MKELAPIIVFAFNRLDMLKCTIGSLLANQEAQTSDLYVFVDGARESKANEANQVKAVQEYVKSISGFKKVEYTFSNANKGLGNSIIEGVSLVINKYGRVIVLEDDLVFASNFLAFMNEGLSLYANEEKVFSICGYTSQVQVPPNYPYDAYFCTRSSSWGWATWANRWNTVDWELRDWDKYSKRKESFNKWGGSDCFRMLRSVKEGWGDSWAIRFCFSQFMQDKLSLFPIISKVENDGFDGEGTNCKKWSRFKHEFDMNGRRNFNLPSEVIMNSKLFQSAMSYHTICIRIWSKIMYLIYS